MVSLRQLSQYGAFAQVDYGGYPVALHLLPPGTGHLCDNFSECFCRPEKMHQTCKMHPGGEIDVWVHNVVKPKWGGDICNGL